MTPVPLEQFGEDKMNIVVQMTLVLTLVWIAFTLHHVYLVLVRVEEAMEKRQ